MSSPVFTQNPYLYAFFAAFCTWLLSDLSIGLRCGTRADSPQDRGSKRAIGAAVGGGVFGAVVASVAAPVLRIPAPIATFWVGIGLMLFGVLLRQYAVRTLDAYFSLEVSVAETDSVVDSGPYQWVRHPSYTGGLATLVGIGIAAGNWASVGIVTVTGVLAYGYRIRVEERALTDQLGEAYDNYTTRTQYRLVPFVR